MEEVETEVENMECLEDPGLEDTENLTDEKEDDPDWHCQMEDKGDDDIDADDEETESTPMNNIRQDVMIFIGHLVLILPFSCSRSYSLFHNSISLALTFNNYYYCLIYCSICIFITSKIKFCKILVNNFRAVAKEKSPSCRSTHMILFWVEMYREDCREPKVGLIS